MSVLLTGYRGCGKTTLGQQLAAKLGWAFVDLDTRIVDSAGISIRQIFERLGEPVFRQMESNQLSAVLPLHHHVISLGGGTVLAEENRRAIKSAGHPVVYLRATAEELHRRIVADPATAAQRPALTHLGGTVDEVRTLLAQREPLYQQLKSVELDVNFGSIEKLVDQLHAMLIHQ